MKYSLPYLSILIVTGLYFDCFILQRLLDEFGLVALALVLPATYVEVVLVVALGFAFLRLVFLTEVATAGLVTGEGVEGHKLSHGEEVAEVDRLVEFCVQTFFRAGHKEIGVELFLEFVHLLKTGLQTL